MGRVALTKTKLIAVVAVVAIAGGGGGYAVWHNHDTKKANVAVASTQATTTYISYTGEEGKDALTLLKAHATVVTKNSSLGEYVVSVNGNDGGGTKYWIFYINGAEAQVGAGAYTTKSTDNIEWKLQ